MSSEEESAQTTEESEEETSIKEVVLPDEIEKEHQLIESIIEIEDENVDKMNNEIGDDDIQFIKSILTLAVIIRPKKKETYFSLFEKLEKRLGNTPKVNRERYFPEGSVANAILNDDIDEFIRLTSDPQFNPQSKINVDGTTFSLVDGSKEITYLQLMCLLGAVKCFKHAILTKQYNTESLAKHAVAGGNNEIIHIIEQSGASFDNCLQTAQMFHRHEIYDWLKVHSHSNAIKLAHTLYDFNYKSFFNEAKEREIDQNELNSCVMAASSSGEYLMLKYLVETCKANPNTRDMNGFTPLFNACKNGFLPIVKYLVEQHNSNINSRTRAGLTPLQAAVSYNHLNIIKYFINELHIGKEEMNSAIYGAAAAGNLKLLKYFVEELKCDVEEMYPPFGFTLMHIAARAGFTDIIEYLYEHCHANAEVVSMDWTPLHQAVMYNKLSSVKCLIEKCHVNPNPKNKGTLTPLGFAIQSKCKEIIEYFIKECKDKLDEEEIKQATEIIGKAQ